MLDLTVPMVEVWFSGAKLGEYANDLEALKAASLHADSLPLLAESVEYEIRRDTMKYIVHRRITGPDAPALGPVLTISSTALTVTLDRPASGPTQIDRYELERLSGSTWTQIASGLSIFGESNSYADTGLTASTFYGYRCRAVDTTNRASEFSYSIGTTAVGESNSAPVWQSGTVSLSVEAGSSVRVSDYCSDPEGDSLKFLLLDTNPNDSTITVTSAGVVETTQATIAGVNSIVVQASDGLLTANKTIALTVTAVSATVRNVFAVADFSLGYVPVQPTAINQADSQGRLLRLNSGLYIGTTPITQSAYEAYVSGSSPSTAPVNNWSVASLCDTHVVASELVSEGGFSETVTPRTGSYFLRSKMYRAKDTSYGGGVDYASPGTGQYPTKHYENCLNNSGITAHNDSLCNPRSAFYLFNRTVYGIDWDQEHWFGYSVYVPLNYEDESVGRGETYNGPMLISMNPNDPGKTHLTLNAIVPDSGWTAYGEATSGATKTHWCVQWYLNNSGTTEANATRISLGEIVKGRWTDFVFRLRWNPFTSATTSNGINFAGGSAGRIQIWQGVANTDGTRTISSGSPVYSHSGPCGLLPNTMLLTVQPRMYMFGWKPTFSTTRTHPVWMGFDELRLGFTAGPKVVYQNNTAAGFNDVAPGSA